MSFDRSVHINIANALQQSRDERKHNSLNLLHASTLGLPSLHRDIASKPSWMRTSSSLNNLYMTDNDGFLDLRLHSSPSTVVIGRRYQCQRLLASGTFAQIIVARDLYMNRNTALKIVKRGCEVLAQREKVFLDILSTSNSIGLSYFVRCYGTITFASHQCIVLFLYQGTLMDFIGDTYALQFNQNRVQKAVLSTPQHLGSHSTIIQPRAIRSSTPSNHFAKQSHNRFSTAQRNQTAEPQRLFSSEDLSRFRKIALHLVSALCILQQKEIIHGDLKPENCFLEYQSPLSSSSSSSSHQIIAMKYDLIHQRPSPPSTHNNNQPSHQQQQERDMLHSLPSDFLIKLGDFGNSLHVSELHHYYDDYEVQSLPYRAPEVLLGMKFTGTIDVWSLGIILIELITGQTLFTCNTREEALTQIKSKISDISRMRFSSGKFSSCLSTINSSKSEMLFAYDHGKVRSDQFRSLKRLLVSSVQLQFPVSTVNELVDFITSLTIVDPTHRFTPLQALHHPFLVSCYTFPIALLKPQISSDNSNEHDVQAGKRRKRIQHQHGIYFASLHNN